MTILQFLDSVLGTFPTDMQFIRYIIAGVFFVVICSLILTFFLGAISGLTTRFFK